ncbi:MAG: thiolase family protein [Burkholderiales bacterium]
MRPAHIPYGAYWSTPFARWQGSLSHLHPLELAAHVARAELAKRRITPDVFDYGVLGYTVPSPNCFYGLPWVTAMLGAPHVGGPSVNQACATSARVLQMATQEVSEGGADCALLITADKLSNGPHLYFPHPGGPGGTGGHEDWVLDNFSKDPYAQCAMIQTAENVAKKFGISTAEQHDVVAHRYRQYDDARASEGAFHKRFMTLPFEIPDAKFKKPIKTLACDEGIHATTAAGLAELRPVQPGGTVTYGGQTHPADGNACMVVTTRDKARDLATDPKISVRVLGFGLARTEKAFMPQAPVPASRRALDAANLSIRDIDCVKSHNPFAVNDIVFSRETGFDWRKMNNYGCSLVWGHPQGPTGLRAVIELIEELAMRGGGRGLFHGCAAGDTAMALVVEVSDIYA